MKVDGLLSAFKTTMSSLSTQTRQLNLIAENLENVESTPDENGKVYQRKVLVQKGHNGNRHMNFSEQLSLKMRRTSDAHLFSGGGVRSTGNSGTTEYKVVEEKGENLVYNPDHPMADENGYVKMPNVNPVEEMVDLVTTSRAFEANVTVINAAKQMAKKSLEI